MLLNFGQKVNSRVSWWLNTVWVGLVSCLVLF